ncbi:MAG: hypothetical protein ABFS21_10950 [Actinomycetota bacterium]
MPDLDMQIREYIETTSAQLTADDILHIPLGDEAVRPLVPRRSGAGIRKGWAIATASAAAAMLIIGGAFLLPRLDDGTIVADSDSASATEPEIVTTTAPPPAVGDDGLPSVVPGLGTLTWVKIEGDESTLPGHFQADADGGYISYDAGKVWRSDDAVTWTVGGSAGPLAGFTWIQASEDWAIGGSVDESVLFRRSGGEWIEVQLPEAPLPATTGVTWKSFVQMPIESNGVTVVPAPGWGQVAWSDYFGVFEVDCDQDEPCEIEPYAMWDPATETFRLENPTGIGQLATLEMRVEGETVSFIDTDTGETVHTITGSADYPAGRIAEQLRRGQSLAWEGGYVSRDGSPFVWTPFPMEGGSSVVVVPDGGFAAYDIAHEVHANGIHRIVSATAWTSENGVDWTDRGAPPFADLSAEAIRVLPGDTELRAQVVLKYDHQRGRQTGDAWNSTNGVDWTRADTDTPFLFDLKKTDFGWVSTSLPQNRYEFWVSTDGEGWQQVEGPRGSHEPNDSGFSTAGGAGDVLYVIVGNDETGERTLWIGSFEQAP